MRPQAQTRAAEREVAQRLTRVEQAQSSASIANPRSERHSDRCEHKARPREARRDLSESAQSSGSESASQTSRASPRKRAVRSHVNPDPAMRLVCSSPRPRERPARTCASPRVADDRSTDSEIDAVELCRVPSRNPHRSRSPTCVLTHTRTRSSSTCGSQSRYPQFSGTRNALTTPRLAPQHSHSRSTAEQFDWDPADRDTLLKATSRPRFLESSGVKIRSFLADAELFLTLCNRPRSRWAYFVLSWLGSEEAEKVRRSHVADSVADYEKFREGVTTLFGRFEFEGAFRAQLRTLKQSGSESAAAYAARTTDLCSRAYAEFATDAQLSLAVDHFIGGLADASTRDYLLRERARRPLEWIEVVRMAQASETARLSSVPLGAAAVCESSAIGARDSSVCAPVSAPRDLAHENISQPRARPDHAPAHSRNFGNRRDHASKSNVREDERTPTRQQGLANQSQRAAKPVQSGAAKSNSSVCFNCGRPGHLAANCSTDSKKIVRCYACGGAGHFARDCANRKAQMQSESRDPIAIADDAQSEYSSSKSLTRSPLRDSVLAIFLARGDRVNPRKRSTRGHWLVLLR